MPCWIASRRATFYGSLCGWKKSSFLPSNIMCSILTGSKCKLDLWFFKSDTLKVLALLASLSLEHDSLRSLLLIPFALASPLCYAYPGSSNFISFLSDDSIEARVLFIGLWAFSSFSYKYGNCSLFLMLLFSLPPYLALLLPDLCDLSTSWLKFWLLTSMFN